MSSILQRAAAQYMRTIARFASHEGGYALWKNLTLFAAISACGLGMRNAYLVHLERKKHEKPKFVPYDYLRVRTKRFPWGDGERSLFHNPHVNALPSGYEDSQ